MRTTIEITGEQRARLLELAAMRGEKGFSRLVQEALDDYLSAQDAAEKARRRAIALRGVLKRPESEALRETATELRNSWR